jgi:hypothetical protein
MFYLAQYATVGKEKIPRMQIIVKNQAIVSGQVPPALPAQTLTNRICIALACQGFGNRPVTAPQF